MKIIKHEKNKNLATGWCRRSLRAIHQKSWNRVEPLATDLLEDFYKLILMLLFVGICAILESSTVNVITVIVGDTPTIVKFIGYAAEASFIINYCPYLFNHLKMPDTITGKRILYYSSAHSMMNPNVVGNTVQVGVQKVIPIDLSRGRRSH